MSLIIVVMLRLAAKDLDTTRDGSKLVNGAVCMSHKRNMQETFPFCSDSTSSLLLNYYCYKQIERVWVCSLLLSVVVRLTSIWLKSLPPQNG